VTPGRDLLGRVAGVVAMVRRALGAGRDILVMTMIVHVCP
jgi:hypothetical protein